MCLYREFLPCLEIRFYFDLLQSVQHGNIEFPDRTVVCRRIACRYNDPSGRDLMPSECLVLQELQHAWCQCLGYTVDLIKEQDAVLFAGPFHLIID